MIDKNKDKINIYIDGFNLYYLALKNTPYKWLDVKKLCSFYFKKFIINEINYFTANVKKRANDPNQPIRQQIYLRALETIPKLEIIRGSFLTSIKWMPIVPEFYNHKKKRNKKTKIDVEISGIKFTLPIFVHKDKFQYIPVIRSEEKGSDVNLATHLLRDAYEKKFDAAVVLSNDSDLKEAIKIVVGIGLPVFVLNPAKKENNQLKGVATNVRMIRAGALRAAQFPNELKDKVGIIKKPNSW